MTRAKLRELIQATQDTNAPILESGEMSSEDDPMAYIIATAIDGAEDRAGIEQTLAHAIRQLYKAKRVVDEEWDGGKCFEEEALSGRCPGDGQKD